MSNNLIKLEDGSRWELIKDPCNKNELNPRVDVARFMFKRLPPPTPIQDLRVGYTVRFEVNKGSYYLVTQAPGSDWFKACKNAGSLGEESIYNKSKIKEVYCPHRGLIWEADGHAKEN